MNFLGHAAVAEALGLDAPGQVLGAMLPDLVSMGGFTLDPARLPSDVAAGVACHHRADAAFHTHPAFLEGSHALRDDLALGGVTRGAARAVAHVGWELLLDGAILRTSGLGAVPAALDEAPGLGIGDRARWEEFVGRLRDRAPWDHYGDPEGVATVLFHVLARRPRLAFPDSAVPTVAASLSTQAMSIAGVHAEVLADVIDRTRSG